MINKESLQKAGTILKAHGIGGELTVIVNLDLFEKSEEMESMFIETDGYLVPFFLEEIREKNDKRIIIKFCDINSDVTANQFKNCDVYIEKKYAGSGIDMINYNNLENYRLFDQTNRPIGIISGYYNIPENPVLVIKNENSEFFVPANKELIISVDHENRKITVKLTEGIMDL